MSNITDEIKSRLDIADTISEYIHLNQAGVNWKAICPFHREKTPSLFVSTEKQIWHCFGCGAGGDIFEFVKKIEGVEFPEALRILAQKANVTIDYNYNPELSNKKTKILDILEESANYYHKNLIESNNAKIARDYLENRGMTQESIRTFLLGYSEDSWTGLLDYLKSKGFIEKDIEASGMILKSKQGSYSFYDRFRGRLMFPINNIFGQTVGFTARALKEDDNKQGKYINTPQTDAYDKSSVLYNLDLAKVEIKNKNYTVLVEGNIDAISSYMSGVKNVVASSGTALTKEQVKILKRYSENLIIAYDGDLAGVKATFRIIDNALSQNMNVKIVSLPKGIDPDDLIKRGTDKWIDAIKKAKPIMDFVFDRVISSADLNNVFHKKQVAKTILVFISKFSDEIEKETYLKKLSDIIDIDYDMLKKKLGEIISNKKNKEIEQKDSSLEYSPIDKNKIDEFLKEIIALSMNFPENLEYLSSNLELEYIQDNLVGNLYKDIIIHYTKNNSFSFDLFKKSLDVERSDLLDLVAFVFENGYSDYDKNQAFVEIQKLVLSYKEEFLNKKLKQTNLLMNKARIEKNSELEDKYFRDLNDINIKKRNLK
ncbi:MAG: DNA primase [Patescibacteria group bacterium]|nr:DNA primase [Patescibacteria group bacterium]MDD4304029.1 DNA primase [Patescibacteria group bacterium]MDD4694906.1 DNA primase [Patescibacteria group bacterium]